MHPTNDWRLASLLISLLSPVAPSVFSSANLSDSSAYTRLLDGLTILTNTLSELDLEANPFQTPQFQSLLMHSDSSQAGTIAAAIDNLRALQPGHYFRQP